MRHRRPPKRGGTTSDRTRKRTSPGARRTGRHAGGCRDRTVRVTAGIGPEATGRHGRSRGDVPLADTRCTRIQPPGRIRTGYPLLSGRARQRTCDGNADRYVVSEHPGGRPAAVRKRRRHREIRARVSADAGGFGQGCNGFHAGRRLAVRGTGDHRNGVRLNGAPMNGACVPRTAVVAVPTVQLVWCPVDRFQRSGSEWTRRTSVTTTSQSMIRTA